MTSHLTGCHEPAGMVYMADNSALHYFTNQEFADAVGIHHSMASRLRSGDRLPSADLMDRISQFFDVPIEELHEARRNGPTAFGVYLRTRCVGESQ